MQNLNAVSGETVAKLDRIRTLTLLAHAVLFAAAQIALAMGQGSLSPQVDFCVWALWVAVLVLTVTRAGFVSITASVRAYLNDEMTRMHLREACTVAYLLSTIALIAGYGLVRFHLLAIDGLSIARCATDIGIVVTLLTFVLLEWRAQHAE